MSRFIYRVIREDEDISEGIMVGCRTPAANERETLDRLRYHIQNGSNESYTFTGEWENGKPNGYGIKIYSDGTTNRGYFKDGKLHGYGVCHYSDGTIKHMCQETKMMMILKKYMLENLI